LEGCEKGGAEQRCEREKSEMKQDSKLKEKPSQGREKRSWVRWERVKKRRNM